MTIQTTFRSSARLVFATSCILLAAATAGCANESMPTDSSKSQALTRGASLAAFALSRPQRTQSDLAVSATLLRNVLSGRSNSSAAATAALANVPAAAADAVDVDIGPQPGHQFSYRADNDRRLVMDANVTANTGASQDIGAAAARTVFVSSFQAALSTGLAPAVGLDATSARMSRIVQGEGVSGQAPVEKTSEYIFTVPRAINGIEVFESGVEISVHRTGQVARVSAFGPAVASTVDASGKEVPDANGYAFTASVDSATLDARVTAEHPSAQVTPVGVRYWLPPGVAKAVVEPRQMYFVVPKAVINGQTVLARGTYVAYSLRDAAAKAAVWPQPAQNAPGTGQK